MRESRSTSADLREDPLDGTKDIARAVEALSSKLPSELTGLAELAVNYWWSWTPEGVEIFRSLDAHRWRLCDQNPVRLLGEVPASSLERAARDETFVARVRALVDAFRADRARSVDEQGLPGKVAFLCTEFAVHRSLPIYAGGLGVLAGDILKEASDRALPYVGVGLLYRQGYFHQRIDTSGWQHEYWTDEDPERMPTVLVTGEDGQPLTINVPIGSREVCAQIWRVDVGRVPLYLLDTERPENSTIDRWITSRLYVGDRRYRLAQYALLGVGGIRALRALGIDPAVVHLNEGHAALSSFELMREDVEAGSSFEQALASARSRVVFTTHTPVAAGNEAYTAEEILSVVGDLPKQLGIEPEDLLALGRSQRDDVNEPFGLTPLGIRVSGRANGVSRLHGAVARSMWQHLFPDRAADDVPIGHVTNGVHVPTWTSAPLQVLFERYLGRDWAQRAGDPATWEAVDAIPDEELWAVRCELRARLLTYVRERATTDRLARGEPIDYVERAQDAFDPNVLTIGFARRAAAYKRAHLLMHDPARSLRLLDDPNPLQIVLAGKPHPMDEEGKRLVQGLFGFKWAPHVADRAAYLEDYHLGMAARLVSGCDVWVNLPRPPMEASGTSGMKAALNGVLNLSVLDGWWDEAYDGANGWAIQSRPAPDAAAQDAQDASMLYDLLENEVVPLFYDRDEHGVPRGWMARVKASLRTIAPRFSATRMMQDYVGGAYRGL